jgi:transposase
MDELIDDLPVRRGPDVAPRGMPRLRAAERFQETLQAVCLDDLIDAQHLARLVWQIAGTFDLQPLLDQIEAREGVGGHPHTDPRILVALWLYATLDGVGSARELARLCRAHVAYRWICGGVSINHHTLSDFRVAHVDWLDQQLIRSIAGLLAAKKISIDTVAQDGLRVRASAASSSFRREPRLREFLRLAAARVLQLRERLEDAPDAAKRRKQAADKRAAGERLAQVQKALDAIDEARARKKRNKGDPDAARVSTTDPQARVMKMPDGGFRPAYNVQLCATTDHALVVGVAVTNSGADQDALVPLQRKILADYAARPVHVLADGGYVSTAAVTDMHDAGVVLYAPVGDTSPQGDAAAITSWRDRMQTDVAKERYGLRGRTIEWVNAGVRRQGLYGVNVRGLHKVRAVALWHALAHNLSRMFHVPALRPA